MQSGLSSKKKYTQKEQEIIINSFKSAGIAETIPSAGLVLKRIENPFHA